MGGSDAPVLGSPPRSACMCMYGCMHACIYVCICSQERGVSYDAASPFLFTLPALSSMDSTRCEYR